MWKFDDLRRELVEAGLVSSETELFAPRDEANNSVLDAAIARAHSPEYITAIEGDALEVSLWRRVGFVASGFISFFGGAFQPSTAATAAQSSSVAFAGIASHVHRWHGFGAAVRRRPRVGVPAR